MGLFTGMNIANVTTVDATNESVGVVYSLNNLLQQTFGSSQAGINIVTGGVNGVVVGAAGFQALNQLGGNGIVSASVAGGTLALGVNDTSSSFAGTFTNLYGPTETTIASSYYTVPRCPDSENSEIPIGTGCEGDRRRTLLSRYCPRHPCPPTSRRIGPSPP